MPGFPLSKQGIEDIKKVGEYFKDKEIEIIYSSPVLRASQSAEILSKILNLENIISPSIEEIYTPMQDQKITYEELFKKKTIPYGEELHIENNGENFDDIFKRVNDFVNSLLKKYRDKNIILVSHGDPIMIYYYTMLGKTFNFEDLLDTPDYIVKAGIIEFVFDKSKYIFSKKIELNNI